MADLVEVSTGDLITSTRANLIKDYIQDGTHKVNTLSLEVGGTEIIDSNRYVKPVRIINPDSNGTIIYDSTGTNMVAKIDDNGNLYIKGRVISL